MLQRVHKLYVVRVSVGGLVAAGVCITALYFYPLPDVTAKFEYSRALYSADGVLLGAKIAKDDQWRFPPVEVLPHKYIRALLRFEDKRFYYHPGIDPLALTRAIRDNLAQGEVVSGGSTITMQLARMLRGNRARNYGQKLLEVLLALRLELKLSKDEILTLYAAYAPFGGNTVGLAAANWRYFGRDITRMTWAEAALFAVLPNDPSSISPGKNRERLRLKRNQLLERLHQQGDINELALKLAKLEPLPEVPLALPNRARHLLETLHARHPDVPEFRSTIDSRLQNQVYEVAEHHIERLGRTNINNLSLLVIDNFNHRTLAYIGNRTYQYNKSYSPAVDIVQRPRSSGSLFKPFLFSMMVQNGFVLPETVVMDVPSYYKGYSPKNYDRAYRGVVTAKQALIESLNVPSVRLLKEYGISAFKQDLEEAGVTTLFRPADDYGLALILGGAEVSLWDITNAYAGLTMAAYGQGSQFAPASLLHGQEYKPVTFPVRQAAAWQTLEALTKVKRPGVSRAWEEFSSSQRIAWKTGTSYGWHDAWAVGSNGGYTVGVWTGNANGEEGRELTGSKAAAPIMFDLFRLLPSVAWPDQPHHALQTIQVCKADGYLPSGGCERAETYAPREAHFSKVSPFHQRVHLDEATGQRVHGKCHRVADMLTKSYFVLPPVAEFYFQKVSAQYPTIPMWRTDCLSSLSQVVDGLPMQLEYPAAGARIKLPVELDSNLGRAVFKARHRIEDTPLYWHLNDKYLGETKHIHEKAIAVNPGWHRLVLVDGHGYRLQRWFKAL